jgi:amidase
VATDVSYGLNTTAGSFALLNSVPISDAQIVSQLRKAGAIIIGKSNMSVWAQARGNLTQGWSPRGRYTSSAYLLHGNPCSSSSGAGVATSVGLAAASIGTETDGSIICPASRNGVVGLKPTVGLASRFGVIPISSSQDTTGPIVQSVSDAAIILTSIMTPKSNIKHVWLDSALASQPEKVSKGINYAKNLFDLRLEEKEEPLKGIRIGVLGGHLLDLELNEIDSEIVDIYYDALNQLKGAGATLVNVSLSITTDADQMSVLNNNRNDVIFAEYQGEYS